MILLESSTRLKVLYRRFKEAWGGGKQWCVMPILGMKAPFVRNFRENFILQYFLYTNTRKNVLCGVFRGFGQALGCLEKLTLGGLL